MNWQPNIRILSGKEQIYCDWRHKFVRLTPEEWVRQQVLHILVEQYAYPAARIAVEHAIMVGDTLKRCDAVVMGERLQPLCIVEFKAENVTLTQRVFDQAAVYNHKLQVPYFVISNGKTTHCCRVTATGYEFLSELPAYDNMNT